MKPTTVAQHELVAADKANIKAMHAWHRNKCEATQKAMFEAQDRWKEAQRLLHIENATRV